MRHVPWAAAILVCAACGNLDQELPTDDVTSVSQALEADETPRVIPPAPRMASAAEVANMEKEIRDQRAKVAREVARANPEALLRAIATESEEGRARAIGLYLAVVQSLEPPAAEAAMQRLGEALATIEQ